MKPRHKKEACQICERRVHRSEGCQMCGRLFHKGSEDWERLHEICMTCCIRISLRLVREASQELTLAVEEAPGVCAVCHSDLRQDESPPWHAESVICIDCLKAEGAKEKGLRIHDVFFETLRAMGRNGEQIWLDMQKQFAGADARTVYDYFFGIFSQAIGAGNEDLDEYTSMIGISWAIGWRDKDALINVCPYPEDDELRLWVEQIMGCEFEIDRTDQQRNPLFEKLSKILLSSAENYYITFHPEDKTMLERIRVRYSMQEHTISYIFYRDELENYGDIDLSTMIVKTGEETLSLTFQRRFH